FFPEEDLLTLNKEGTMLPSHCDMNRTPGVDLTTGSLGQGFSGAVGMALGLKYQKSKSTVYAILGDGECNEGQIWEAALFASTKKLENLIAFVDANKKQLDGYTYEICDLGNIRQKFEDFGFYAQEVDGHDVLAIRDAIHSAQNITDRPSMIVLDTIKGKDCCFGGEYYNHFIRFSEDDYQEAVKQLDQKIADLKRGA
ncbi:MAG TPA: transketolase, partial [Clostridiaceae bacterium]|nr:transketolase [Clostridiaceae bacterium]